VRSLHALASIESVFALTVGPSRDRREPSRYAMTRGTDPQTGL
jgi:hypothetical protein